MGTLLLRLAGPMQSWGTQSRFSIRDTGMEPSKSGVIGLLCASLGRPRSEPVDDLAALRMGVRADREGSVKMDYHTAGGTHLRRDAYGVAKADGSSVGAVTSRRYYLADADFLVGLECCDNGLLRQLERALAQPVWQLCLGRKSFVPGVPVHITGGLCEATELETALKNYPWPRPGAAVSPHREPERLRAVLETGGATGADVRRDQPVGAAFRDRRFALRHVTTKFWLLGADVPMRVEVDRCTSLV